MQDNIGVATAARQAPAERKVLPLRDLIAEVAARRDEFDRLSHVPRDVIGSMKRAGIFRAATPRRFAGGLYPLQPALPVEGGLRVSGRWRFASGCMAAD